MILLGSRDKTFEVALHAGTAAALLVALRAEVVGIARELDAERIGRIGLTLGPAAIAGVAFEQSIEKRLGSPRVVALAQIVAGAALLVADRRSTERQREDTTARDALAIGLAQAAALVPGVSRNGATLTAARLLGFRRVDANRMSRHAALPVIVGAAALQALRGRRLSGEGLAGAAAAFASTLTVARLVPWTDSASSYTSLACYRIALGAGVLALWGRDRPRRRFPRPWSLCSPRSLPRRPMAGSRRSWRSAPPC